MDHPHQSALKIEGRPPSRLTPRRRPAIRPGGAIVVLKPQHSKPRPPAGPVQSYLLVGVTKHVCRNDRIVDLWVWRSECATCGAPFETMTPSCPPQTISCRCPAHKRPGVRTNRPWAADLGMFE